MMIRLAAIAVAVLLLAGCADEKTTSRDLADRSPVQSLSVPPERSLKRAESDKQSQKLPLPLQTQKDQGPNLITGGPPAEIRPPEKELKKSTNTAKPADAVSHAALLNEERKRLNDLFSGSRNLFSALGKKIQDNRLSWNHLRQLVNEAGELGDFTRTQRQSALLWAEYLEHNSQELIDLFHLPYDRQTPRAPFSLEFIREGDSLLTPVQQSMWQHCKRNFENRFNDRLVTLVAGYRSPAYQAFFLSQLPGTLDEVLQSVAPPYFSHHQQPIPDLTVSVSPRLNGRPFQQNWHQLFEVCGAFGFKESRVWKSNDHAELSFIGYDRLYHSTLENQIIPPRLKRDFLSAMDKTGFYPSPDGMRVLFALSAQESTMSWNPRMNRPKKADLKQRFNRILDTIESGFGSKLTELIFSDESNREKQALIEELQRITDPHNLKIREYDFYLWTRKVSRFLNRLLRENKQLTTFGQWFFKLERFANQIQYEPQTFGLWQINVNHLIERIEHHPQLRRRFPEIFLKSEHGWKVDRSRMIDVLSGMPGSVLDRQRALELIIHTYLQPRYQSHMLGDRDDLTYFVAENVAGDMSTFRAAIQDELNTWIGSNLELDGDLSFYQPYSTHIDWERQSNTQKAAQKFILKRYAYFTRPVKTDKLLQDLCEADAWEKLQQSELYRRIMRKNKGKRMFPRIRSALYQQTPQVYAEVVLKKSRLF